MNNFFLLLLIVSCSTFRPESTDSLGSSLLPSWIFSPYDLCKESQELCATGEGKTFQEADLSALSNLGSIFEVQISSDTKSYTYSSQSYPWQGAVSQEVNQLMSQSVNEILQSVQIKNRFKKDKVSYSLASLDRGIVQNLLLEKLKKLDGEITDLWGRKQRTSFRKMFSLSLEREKIKEKYAVVSGKLHQSSVTHSQIMSWRASRPLTEPILLKTGNTPDWVIEKLKDLFTEAGFNLEKNPAVRVLVLNMNSIREYLNVEGFEKYTFSLTLTSFIKGKKQKELNVKETFTGRNQQDALFKAKAYFSNYIENHLSDLNFD
jgi:hypothetical protein